MANWRHVVTVVLLVALSVAACDGMSDGNATRSPIGTPIPTPGGEEPVRYLIRCFAADGRPLGTFSSLDEVWASTNYMQIDYCEATFAGDEPMTLGEEEVAIAEIAASGLAEPQDLAELYLEAVAACTRVSEDGPYGLTTIPDAILVAALTLCPEAPQAQVITEWLAG